MRVQHTLSAALLCLFATIATAQAPQTPATPASPQDKAANCQADPKKCEATKENNRMRQTMADACAKDPKACAERRRKAAERRAQQAPTPSK